MKIAIFGAGAIGCYVGGALASGRRQVVDDVLFVGRERIKTELETHGISLEDVGGGKVSVPAEAFVVTTSPERLAEHDIVLVAVKSAQTAEAGDVIAKHAPRSAIVVSLQNGVGNADVLREHVGDRIVLGGIVSFNVVSKGDGVFRRATTGPLVIEAHADPRVGRLATTLRDAGLETDVTDDIRSQQWSKLVMNLNNAVGALTDAPTRELVFGDRYRRIVALVMEEAIAVMKKAGVRPARLGPLPVSLFPTILRLPSPLLRLAAKMQVEIDPEARSSMWDDLTRGRKTEVDYLNGEIVRLAASCGARAPVNEAIIALVREAEAKNVGSPKMAPEELFAKLSPRR